MGINVFSFLLFELCLSCTVFVGYDEFGISDTDLLSLFRMENGMISTFSNLSPFLFSFNSYRAVFCLVWNISGQHVTSLNQSDAEIFVGGEIKGDLRS